MTTTNSTTDYCKSKCNNVILSKNNVYSTGFSNTSTRMRQSNLLASRSTRVTSGTIIYGNLVSTGGEPETYTAPNAYYNNI